MRTSFSYCWCPECRKWVPSELMNYDDGVMVCTPCLEGTSDQNNYVFDPHHEEAQCPFCDYWNPKDAVINGKLRKYKCKNCGEIFVEVL